MPIVPREFKIGLLVTALLEVNRRYLPRFGGAE